MNPMANSDENSYGAFMLNEYSELLASRDKLIAPSDAARSIDAMTQISLKWHSFAVHPTLASGDKASK
jgi:hypothetical protein